MNLQKTLGTTSAVIGGFLSGVILVPSALLFIVWVLEAVFTVTSEVYALFFLCLPFLQAGVGFLVFKKHRFLGAGFFLAACVTLLLLAVAILMMNNLSNNLQSGGTK